MRTDGARFTPRILPGDILERLFVARQPVLDRLVARIEDAAASGNLAHTLVQGPRGAGKTHLISLVNHRAQRLDGHGDRFRIAWLPEDPYRITDVESFLAQVAKHAKPVGSTAPLTVVLVENLDQVFSRLGPPGQATLRSHLEQRRDLLLLATSPRLTKAVLDHSEPFFGFFATTALEPFTVAQATAMLQKLALANGEPELADRLDGAPTQARLAAIRHLAGGQPRIWAVLASGLTVDTLDDLLSTLVREFDNLTPYYQERLGQLSPNQLKIVLALVDAEGSLSVKDIAHATGVKQGSASVALKELAGAGWVRARTGTLVARETQPSISQLGAPSSDLNGLAGRSDRRNVYYDLAEPLVRVALQLKESEGRPVPLILEFLTSFFSVEELAETARRQAEKTDLKRYTESALLQAGGGSHRLREKAFAAWAANPFAADGPCDPALAAWYERLDDALAEFQSTGKADRLLHLPASLADLVEQQLADRSPAFLRLQLALALSRADSSLGRALDALPGATEQEAAAARWIVACLRAVAGQTEAAWATLAELMEGAPTALGCLYHDTVLTAAKQASPPLGPWKTAALAGWLAQTRGESKHVLTLWLLGPPLGSHDEAVALPPVVRERLVDAMLSASAFNAAVKWRADSGDPTGAVRDSQAIVDWVTRVVGPDGRRTVQSRITLAYACLSAGRFADAIPLLEAALADQLRILGYDHPNTLASRNNLAIAYRSAGRLDDAIPLFEATLADRRRVLGDDHSDTLISRNNLARAYKSAGRLDDAIPLFEATLADQRRVLGDDHPETLTSRHSLARAYKSAGRLDDAIPLFEATLADRRRVLGDVHPDTLMSRNGLAGTYERAGRLDDANLLYSSALFDSERVLGHDHYVTRAIRHDLDRMSRDNPQMSFATAAG